MESSTAWWHPEALAAAAPVLLAWLLAPVLAWWSGRAKGDARRVLDEAQQRELRRVARKTWRFFEAFVGEADNWLPPDNLQEVPSPVVAHRTSPTNIGLALLSNLAAHDFGYLGMASATVCSSTWKTGSRPS